jgi:hypothetical protein
MGSIRLDGVRFVAWSDDHEPRHVHGFYADVEVIVDIQPDSAKLSSRRYATWPPNSKTSDIQHVVRTAAKHAAVLNKLWEEARG